jgi:multiple sugar transport system substrate-binding protein
MYQEGLVPRSAKNESGPTWTRDFANGLIGMQPMGATALQTVEEGPHLQIGVAPIPGLDGGSSSFVGGDVLGIGSNTEHAAQAWHFIQWTLSDKAQVDIVAKNRNVTVRDDLAENVCTQQDPRLVIFTQLAHSGQTPIAVNFGMTFNDPNGPWISAVSDGIFGTEDVSAVLERHNRAITESLRPR